MRKNHTELANTWAQWRERAFGERIKHSVGDAIELRVEVRGQIVEELRERACQVTRRQDLARGKRRNTWRKGKSDLKSRVELAQVRVEVLEDGVGRVVANAVGGEERAKRQTPLPLGVLGEGKEGHNLERSDMLSECQNESR